MHWEKYFHVDFCSMHVLEPEREVVGTCMLLCFMKLAQNIKIFTCTWMERLVKDVFRARVQGTKQFIQLFPIILPN